MVDMNNKISHLIVFQNEMLATALDPKKPKTHHFSKEPVVVDQKKIVDHEKLIKQGQIINNYVSKPAKVPLK